MKISRYLLILVCFIPLFIFRDFTPNNELKYLSIADEALREGHFFTFRNQGLLYADKPPLYLWIVMLGKYLFGTHSMFFLALFSMIPALITIYIMDKWVKDFLPMPWRKSGQLMLITSGLFTGSAIVLRMDMLMCMFIILALYTFYKQYSNQSTEHGKLLLPLYIFLALFTKGPVGILVPLCTMICFLFVKKQIRDFGKYMGWKQWGVLIGLCGIWFLGVYLEGGYEYLDNLLFHQTIHRAIDSYYHKEPFYFYFKTIWYSLAPWTLLYFVSIVIGIRKRLINTDLKKLFLIVIGTTFIALSVFSGKLDIYLLPIFPFIAYLSFLLLPHIPEKYLRFTVIIPAAILIFVFPAIFIAGHFIRLALTEIIVIPVAAFILSSASGISLFLLYKKQLLKATNSLSIGILITILIGSFALPGLNQYIGFEKICQKASTIAHETGIENYYFYNFRSGENMDAYLNHEITKIGIEEIVDLIDKQNFMLFVKNKDIERDKKLQEILKLQIQYSIGDYSIIKFKLN